jgi:O-antigen ligase
VHNTYLLWLAETGVVGAATMGLFVLWALWTGLRVVDSRVPSQSLLAIGFVAGGVALYVSELASFGTREDSISMAFAILLGCMVALRRLEVKGRSLVPEAAHG